MPLSPPDSRSILDAIGIFSANSQIKLEKTFAKFVLFWRKTLN